MLQRCNLWVFSIIGLVNKVSRIILKIFLWTEKNWCGSKSEADLELTLEEEEGIYNLELSTNLREVAQCQE